MENKGTIVCSLFSGMIFGAAITVLMAHKSGHVNSEMIHKRIMDEIKKLKSGYEAVSETLKSNVSCSCDTHEGGSNE